jgi:hypothetical protein
MSACGLHKYGIINQADSSRYRNTIYDKPPHYEMLLTRFVDSVSCDNCKRSKKFKEAKERKRKRDLRKAIKESPSVKGINKTQGPCSRKVKWVRDGNHYTGTEGDCVIGIFFVMWKWIFSLIGKEIVKKAEKIKAKGKWNHRRINRRPILIAKEPSKEEFRKFVNNPQSFPIRFPGIAIIDAVKGLNYVVALSKGASNSFKEAKKESKSTVKIRCSISLG